MGLPIDQLWTDGLSNSDTLFAIITGRSLTVNGDLNIQGLAPNGGQWNGYALSACRPLHHLQICRSTLGPGVLTIVASNSRDAMRNLIGSIGNWDGKCCLPNRTKLSKHSVFA